MCQSKCFTGGWQDLHSRWYNTIFLKSRRLFKKESFSLSNPKQKPDILLGYHLGICIVLLSICIYFAVGML